MMIQRSAGLTHGRESVGYCQPEKAHLHKYFVPFAVLAGLLLAVSACQRYTHEEVSFRAPVVVLINGLYDPGRVVSFTATKMKEGGAEVAGSSLTGDRFTDLLGHADFVFGYSLEYDAGEDEAEAAFVEGARVVATLEYNGNIFTDTVGVYPPFKWPLQGPERITDTLRIYLLAK